MRHLLIIAYYFPPLSSAGTLRMVRIAERLPSYGWTPTVLTVDASSIHNLDFHQLEGSSVNIHRTPIFEPGATRFGDRQLWRGWGRIWDRIAPIDGQIGWIPFATKAGLRILKEGADAILTTGSPFSAHLTGLNLHKKTGLPWFADYRDPWVGNPYRNNTFVDHLAERLVVKNATRSILNIPSVTEMYSKRYPEYKDRFVCLPNGYDEKVFANLKHQRNAAFTLLHCGDIYTHRTPIPFLKAVKLWIQQSGVQPNEAKIRFIGNLGRDANGSSYREQIAKLGLAPYLELMPKVPYSDTPQQIYNADLLLTIGAYGYDTLCVPCKIYDYLASGKPILGVFKGECDAASILANSPQGYVASPDDPEKIAQIIDTRYSAWKMGEAHLYEGPAQYSANRVTEDLAALLNEAVR